VPREGDFAEEVLLRDHYGLHPHHFEYSQKKRDHGAPRALPLEHPQDENGAVGTGFDELVEKVRRYLPDEAARQRIATAGNLRAARDGYYNDRQVDLIVQRVQTLLPAVKDAATSPAKRDVPVHP